MTEQEFLLKNEPHVFAQIKKSVEHERLAHAYLFEGETGTGKHQMSLWLARRLFCTNVVANEPCNVCNNCTRIALNEHPNVQVIKPEGQTIKVDQMRRLQAEFGKKGFESKRQVFIISDAEKMNHNAANSLLKFLEEPQAGLLAILETNALGRILPTIQSRCQLIHFTPLSKGQLVESLKTQGIKEQSALLLASLTNSYEKAIEFSSDEWFNSAKDAVLTWHRYLEKADLQAFIFVQKKLVPLAKEKEQQFTLFQILLFYFRKQRQNELENKQSLQIVNQTLELILQAEQKLRANVAFQNVCEQLVLRIVRLS